MNQINWIIQRNLIDDKTLNGLKKAVVEDNSTFQEVYVVPFSDELDIQYNHEFSNIFYGTTTLIMNASRMDAYRKDIFFDNSRFQMKQYLNIWGSRMLNGDGRVITIGDFVKEKHSDHDEFFIRPNDDTKAFTGYVATFTDFRERAAWADGQNPYYRMDSLILVSRPKQIEKEWRNIIVKGKVVSSSRYSVCGRKSVNPEDVPDDMIRFTENCCEMYTPDDVFVMDVALYEGKYCIIECNCFNDSGFYNHDIGAIVRSINNYVRERDRNIIRKGHKYAY